MKSNCNLRPVTVSRSLEILSVNKKGIATTSAVFTATFENGSVRQKRDVRKNPVAVCKACEYGAENATFLFADETPLFNHDWSNEPEILPAATSFKITREFTGGILRGQTYTETTSVYMPVGFTVGSPVGNGSPYKITAVVPVR